MFSHSKSCRLLSVHFFCAALTVYRFCFEFLFLCAFSQNVCLPFSVCVLSSVFNSLLAFLLYTPISTQLCLFLQTAAVVCARACAEDAVIVTSSADAAIVCVLLLLPRYNCTWLCVCVCADAAVTVFFVAAAATTATAFPVCVCVCVSGWCVDAAAVASSVDAAVLAVCVLLLLPLQLCALYVCNQLCEFFPVSKNTWQMCKTQLSC